MVREQSRGEEHRVAGHERAEHLPQRQPTQNVNRSGREREDCQQYVSDAVRTPACHGHCLAGAARQADAGKAGDHVVSGRGPHQT
jgi:hypothetical protein